MIYIKIVSIFLLVVGCVILGRWDPNDHATSDEALAMPTMIGIGMLMAGVFLFLIWLIFK